MIILILQKSNRDNSIFHSNAAWPTKFVSTIIYEATAAIKEIYPDLPVVAQTAFAGSGDREISLDAGCDAHLSKPIKSEELYRIMTGFLR